MTMTPLAHSWAADDLEAELRDLFIALFADMLESKADEIRLYGTPHLGPDALVQRAVSDDGLALLKPDELEAYKVRYLFKAFRHRNPERGLHFLRTYLRVLYGDYASAAQLWQKTADPYPTTLKTAEEITYTGSSPADYFLTSRVRVDLDTTQVADTLVRALKSVVAARLVLDVRSARFTSNTMAMAGVFNGGHVAFMSGTGV